MLLPLAEKKAYQDFARVVRENEILGPKVTTMIYLAAAMTMGCYP